MEVAHSALATFCISRKDGAYLDLLVFALEADDPFHNFINFKFDLGWVAAIDHEVQVELLIKQGATCEVAYNPIIEALFQKFMISYLSDFELIKIENSANWGI